MVSIMIKEKFKFIDLFSGIGGFHQAMVNLGGECVFASEIDKRCIDVYKKNYEINADYNICEVNEKDIPKHDVLCAGFPCQAFSKAGFQKGFYDTRGTLFFEIERILKYHKTKYIILENVRNLVSHNNGNTWKVIQTNLKNLGYRLTEKQLIISPHQLGIPQLRERVVILGVLNKEEVDKYLEIDFGRLHKKEENNIYDIIDDGKVEDKYYISEYEKKVLTAWNEFYLGIKQNIIGFPIWYDYFKNKRVPQEFPKWKKEFIRKNQDLYKNNKEFIDSWIIKYKKLKDFVPTHRKFEWQAGDSIKNIWEGLIQFRPSGIRVKKTDNFPALVALVQIPIIGKYKRRLTVDEARKLQNFPDSFIPDEMDQQAYKQFGNAVNVKVIEHCAKRLFNSN